MSDVVMEEKTSRKRKKKLQKRKPSSGDEDDEEDGNEFSHPSHRGSGPPPGRASFSPDPHIHAGGPHPGMRMPPQMGTQQGGRSGGKGMWHWMLPFYTVGVIIFLLYTLSKILWKSPKKKKKYGMRYKSRKDEYELDSEANSSDVSYESEEEETEKGKLSNKELRGLQKRLNQTEGAMQRILEQLETISGSVDQSTAESVKRMTMDTLNNLAHAEASDLVADVENSSRSLRPHKQRRNEDGGIGGGQYLQDLEKALTDFKRFTDNYVQQHSANAESKGTKVQEREGDKQQEAEEQENSEEEEGGGQLQQGSDQEDSEDEDEEEEECESSDPHPQESKEQKQDLEDGDEESTDDDDDEGSENDVASAANDVDQLKKRGFDPMEGENSDLRIPDVHGEIIPVDENGIVKKDKDSVRKRSKKM